MVNASLAENQPGVAVTFTMWRGLDAVREGRGSTVATRSLEMRDKMQDLGSTAPADRCSGDDDAEKCQLFAQIQDTNAAKQ